MTPLTLSEIWGKAEELSRNKKNWHFHLLTPECLLNKEKKFVLVVENGTDGEAFSYSSNEKPMDTSKKLLELLHGSQIFDDKKEDVGEVSTVVKNMMERAKKLNEKGFFWHHHVLFPNCIYNKHQGKWTIILEDPEVKELLESVSEKEPKADMKEIEPAFYHQNVK